MDEAAEPADADVIDMEAEAIEAASDDEADAMTACETDDAMEGAARVLLDEEEELELPVIVSGAEETRAPVPVGQRGAGGS